jgi:hypothetical protein
VRSSLVITGIFTAGLGLLFYVLELPFVFNWSFPFMVGGLIFVIVGAIVHETPGYIEPPPGYMYCVFCNTSILIGTKRCERCDGVQPN